MLTREVYLLLVVNALIVHFPSILKWLYSIWCELTRTVKFFKVKHDAAKSSVGDLPTDSNAIRELKKRYELSDSEDEYD